MGIFQLITFSGSKTEKQGRAQGTSVIGTAQGDNSRDYDSEIFQGHGIVSRPSKKTRGVRIRIGNLAIVIGAYTYGVEPPASEGACKLYGTNLDGVEKSSILLGANGKVTVNQGADFAVRYSALETAFNQLKSDFDTFASTHVHPGVTVGSGSTGIATATPSTADISGAKVEEILIP